MAKVVTVFVAALLLIGCVQIEKYPDEWGALNAGTQTEICPKISGVYGNVGEKPDGKRAWLGHMLSGATEADSKVAREARYQYWKDLSAATRVQLLLKDGPTLAIAVVGEGIHREWSVPNTQFECRTGAIIIHQGGVKGGDNAIAVGSGSLSLYRTGDRLILNSSGGGVGVLLFVPVVGYSSGWARFSLIEER